MERIPFIDTSAGKAQLFVSIDVAASGDNTIVSADAANKIKVVSYVLVADGVVLARWKRGSTNMSGAMSFIANTGVSAIGSTIAHLFETGVNEALIINLSAAIGVRGHLSYFKEP